MDKKFEDLKIKYENSRTWLLTWLALMVTISIAYYTVQDISFKNSLARLSQILVLVVIIFFIIQTLRYHKILNYLNPTKKKRTKLNPLKLSLVSLIWTLVAFGVSIILQAVPIALSWISWPGVKLIMEIISVIFYVGLGLWIIILANKIREKYLL